MDDPPDAAELRSEDRFTELGLEDADDETFLAAPAARPELLQTMREHDA